MRIKNREIRRRRHRKEQAIKLAVKEAKSGPKKPRATTSSTAKPAAKKPAAKKPAVKKQPAEAKKVVAEKKPAAEKKQPDSPPDN